MRERIPVKHGDRLELFGHREDGTEFKILLPVIELEGELWLCWDFAPIFYVTCEGVDQDHLLDAMAGERVVKL